MAITPKEAREQLKLGLNERVTLRQLEFKIDEGLLEGRKTFYSGALTERNTRDIIIKRYKKAGWQVNYVEPQGYLYMDYK